MSSLQRILTLSIILLPLLAATTQSQTTPPTPTAPEADLAVVGVRFIAPQPYWEYGAPNNTELEVVITNRAPPGTPASAYRLLYEWVGQDGSVSWLNGDESTSFDVSRDSQGQGPVGPGQTRTHEMPWNLQTGQAGLGDVRVTVEPPGGSAADARFADNVFHFETFVPTYDVEFSMVGGTLFVGPDETRFARAEVKNRGNAPVNITSCILDEKGRCTKDPQKDARLRLAETLEPETFAIPADSARSLTLYVRYPFTGDFQGFNTSYILNIITGFGTSLNVTTPNFANASFVNRTGMSFQVTDMTRGPLLTEPGGSVAAEFRLRNTGLRDDSYRLRAVVEAGWVPTVEPVHVPLLSQEKTDVQVRLRAPGNAVPGSRVGFVVEFESERLLTVEKRQVLVQVNGPSPALGTVRSEPQVPFAGDAPKVLVEVRNTGNRPMPAGSRVVLDAKFLANTWTFDRSVAGLGADQVDELVFQLPALAQRGDLNLTARLEPGSPTPPVAPSAATLKVHEPRISVAAPPHLAGVPGETVGYRTAPNVFTVTNRGLDPETLVLTARAVRGTARIEGSNVVEIAPGQQRMVAVDHLLPRPSGTAVTDQVTLSVSIVGRPSLQWSNGTLTRITDRTPPTIALSGQPPQEWAVGGLLPLRVTATDDATVQLVEANVTRPDGTTTRHPLSPDAGGRQWSLFYTIGAAGNHSFEFRAVDPSGHHATTAPFRVLGREVAPPRLVVERPASGDVLLSTDQVSIRVFDDVGVDVAAVRALSQDTGDLAVTVVDGRITFDLAWVKPGSVQLVVEATNRLGARANVTLDVIVQAPVPLEEPPEAGQRDGKAPAPGWLAVPVVVLIWVLRRRL